MVGTSNSGLVDGKYDDPAHKQRHVASIENRDARREKIRAEIRADPDFYKGERIGNFLVKGKAFHTGSRPRVTSTAVNRTRRGDTSGDMRVKIDGKAYSRKDPNIKRLFLEKGRTDWYESEQRLTHKQHNGLLSNPKRSAIIADVAREREKKATGGTHLSRDMDQERRVGLSTGAFKNLTKGDVIGNFLVKGRWGDRDRKISDSHGIFEHLMGNTKVDPTENKNLSPQIRAAIQDRRDKRLREEGSLDKGNKSDQELPRAKKTEKKFNPETDPAPIPQYEREDKCNDTELKTPPEKKIKKEDEIEKDRLGGNFTDSHGDTMYSRGKPTGSVSYDDKGTGTVVHSKSGNWLTTDSPNQTGDVVSRSKQKDTTTRAGRRFMRKGEVVGNFLVKGVKSHPLHVVSGQTKGTNAASRHLYEGQDAVSSGGKRGELNPKYKPGTKTITKDSKNECPCAGAKVEMEHKDTLMSLGIPEDKIPDAAKKIAADHVKEDPEYYKKLKQMESVHKAEVEPDPEESEIRQLRFKSRLSPSIKDLKEVQEVKEVKKDDIKREWMLDLDTLMKSDREFSGTFHKPVIDKENDIIPAVAMDKAMDDFMILPTLQEVHTERPVGIITKAWKNGEDEYYLEGKIKPGDDCDDVWQKIKKGEYDGLSIGGRRIKYSKECAIPSLIRDTPCVTHRLKLYNVSVCSSPVNPEASIDEFNKVAKSETGVGEEVFDLTETLKKAMTAGTSSTTGSNLTHGIFDGRKKNVTEDEVDKGAWTSKRGISAGLQQTSMRAAEVRPRMAQKPRNQNRVIRVNRATLPGGKFSKSDILQLIDSINELSKSWSTKAPLGSKGESQHESAKAALKGGNPRRIARASAQTARFREQDKSRDSEMKEFREGKAAAGLRNLTKSDIHQLIDMIGEISKGFATHKGNELKGRSEKGKLRHAASVSHYRERKHQLDKEHKELYKEPIGTSSAMAGLKNMTKSDDDDQKPIREGEKAKRKEKSQGEDYHDGKLEKGDEDSPDVFDMTPKRKRIPSFDEQLYQSKKDRDVKPTKPKYGVKNPPYKMTKGDNMDEEVYEDVENVEKGDDELITKSDIDALTDAIMGLQKSFESYFSSLTVPQPQKLSGKGHEVTDTMKKSEDEIPVNNAEVIAKAYDDKIKTLEEKIAKMENTTIRKGGEAVIIPEQLSRDDPILTNMSILNGIGRMSK